MVTSTTVPDRASRLKLLPRDGEQEREDATDEEETIHSKDHVETLSTPTEPQTQHTRVPNTIIIPCHLIRLGDILMLHGRPSHVIRIGAAPTGQHRYLGVDIFDKRLHEESSFLANPAIGSQVMLGPVFKQYRLLDIQDDTVVAMTETGDVEMGVPILDNSNLQDRLYQAFNEGSSIRILILIYGGRDVVVDMRVTYAPNLGATDTRASDTRVSGFGGKHKPVIVKHFTFQYPPESKILSTPDHIESTAVRHTANSFKISQYDICLTENQVQNGPRSILKVLNRPNDYLTPLYRWIHLKPLDSSGLHVMRFEEFTEEVTKQARELLNWSSIELDALSRVVKRVDRQFKKSSGSYETSARLMEPSFCAATARREDLPGNNLPSSKTVSWICLPYICLKEYAAEPSDLPEDSYPIRSLMRGSSLRDRDLNQAVCNVPETDKGHCYHIAQMWCLILDNSLLFTYGIFSADLLRRLEIREMPEPSSDRQVGEIIASFGRSVKWSLPMGACKTLFELTTHFLDFWPRRLQFRHEGVVLDPEAWLDLSRRKSRIHLTLELLSDDGPEPTDHAFQAFDWLNAAGSDQSRQPRTSIHDLLLSMENFLRGQATSSAVYDKCEERSRQHITPPNSPDGRSLLNHLDSIFFFFFTEGSEGPTVSKYWGAVDQLLQEATESTDPDASTLTTIEKELRGLTREIRNLTQTFFHTSMEKTPIAIPVHLQRAWLHVVMSLIDFKSCQARSGQHIRNASSMIKIGMTDLIKSLRGAHQLQLQNALIPLPVDVAWQISSHLLGDTETESKEEPLSANVGNPYSKCLKDLESAISDRPWDRSHLEKITFLKEEINVIKEVFNKQKDVFGEMISFRTRVQKSAGGGSHHNELPRSHHSNDETNTSGIFVSQDASRNFESDLSYHNHFQSKIPQSCLSSTQDRIEQLTSLQRKLSSLETMVKRAIDDNKDQQASAIYAFTIVTVIFLPLSTIASIFGMNTNDIRNTETNQWLFWAVSLPITIIIVPLALLWAGGRGIFSAALFYWFSGGGKRRES